MSKAREIVGAWVKLAGFLDNGRSLGGISAMVWRHIPRAEALGLGFAPLQMMGQAPCCCESQPY